MPTGNEALIKYMADRRNHAVKLPFELVWSLAMARVASDNLGTGISLENALKGAVSEIVRHMVQGGQEWRLAAGPATSYSTGDGGAPVIATGQEEHQVVATVSADLTEVHLSLRKS
jgi:hypothetical protein